MKRQWSFWRCERALTDTEPNGQMMERRPVIQDGSNLQMDSDHHNSEQNAANLHISITPSVGGHENT